MSEPDGYLDGPDTHPQVSRAGYGEIGPYVYEADWRERYPNLTDEHFRACREAAEAEKPAERLRSLLPELQIVDDFMLRRDMSAEQLAMSDVEVRCWQVIAEMRRDPDREEASRSQATRRTWTEAELIEQMQRLAAKLGHTPRKPDLQADPESPSEYWYSKIFGGLRAAQEAAGLEPNERGQEAKAA